MIGKIGGVLFVIAMIGVLNCRLSNPWEVGLSMATLFISLICMMIQIFTEE